MAKLLDKSGEFGWQANDERSLRTGGMVSASKATELTVEQANELLNTEGRRLRRHGWALRVIP